MITDTLHERCRKWPLYSRGQRFGFTADDLEAFVNSEISRLRANKNTTVETPLRDKGSLEGNP